MLTIFLNNIFCITIQELYCIQYVLNYICKLSRIKVRPLCWQKLCCHTYNITKIKHFYIIETNIDTYTETSKYWNKWTYNTETFCKSQIDIVSRDNYNFLFFSCWLKTKKTHNKNIQPS